MQFISYLVQRFYNTEFQNFTERLAGAVSIFEAIEQPSAKAQEDYEKLRWIAENTNKKIMVSLFKLDMCVNKNKDKFREIMSKAKFIKNDAHDDDTENKITLYEDQIQFYLCMAGLEINKIVSRNIKPYCDEFKLNFGQEETEKKEEINEMDGIK